MKRVLVTGATGFVGSHALQTLATNPQMQVIAACRDRSRLPGGFGGAVRAGDVNDEDYLASLFEGIDIVCNAFAWTSLYGHADSSRRLFLQPSLRLVEAAHRAGVSRFINISTTSAAAPEHSADAMSRGIARHYWPHLCNVIRIEDALREQADDTFEVVNLRLGIFAGARYALGLLPILVPRLKTHLVPWVAGGRTALPIVDGRDIGHAIERAASMPARSGYLSLNIVGPSVPTAREVIGFICEHGHPRPHFSVPFWAAFAFAWLMERLDPIVPWEPLVTRSIIHLLRDTHADNTRATEHIGYAPQHAWRDAVAVQLAQMARQQGKPMSMARPVH